MPWDREHLERTCVRNLLATPDDRVFFKDLESRFLLVSKGWALDHAPGRTPDQLIGMSDDDFFSREQRGAPWKMSSGSYAPAVTWRPRSSTSPTTSAPTRGS